MTAKNQCFGRMIRDGDAHRGRFADNHRFFLEYRCSNQVEEDQLCRRCLEWKTRGINKKDPYRCHHGFITDMIPEWSHIYEGPWYESKVGTYGQPSESDMGRAKKAQVEAREGVDVKEGVVDVKEKPKKERKKREKKTAPVPVPVTVTPVTVTVTSVAEVKPVTKRRYTKKQPVLSTPPIVEKPKVQIQAVEAPSMSMSMLDDLEVIKIVVRPFSHNNTSYFLNSTKNKLYSVGKDKRPTAYVGRWNPEAETIDTDFPDSDAE